MTIFVPFTSMQFELVVNLQWAGLKSDIAVISLQCSIVNNLIVQAGSCFGAANGKK